MHTHLHNLALPNLLRKVQWKAEVLLRAASHHKAQMYQWPLLWLEELLDRYILPLFFFFFLFAFTSVFPEEEHDNCVMHKPSLP